MCPFFTNLFGFTLGSVARTVASWRQGRTPRRRVRPQLETLECRQLLSTAVGDFNADGYQDLALGSPNDGPGSIAQAGLVHVMYGSKDGLSSAQSQLWRQ